jgi:AcrR family transcriptional regulator
VPAASARRHPSTAGDGRGKLSRDQVVDAAIALADADGLDALTLRKLAVSLGVTPMALYWHVADKDALLDALGDRLFASIVLPDVGDDWFEDLCAVAQAMVEALRRHPAIAPLAVTTVMTSEAGIQVAERVLGRLCDARFSDRDAANLGAYLLQALVVLVTALPGGTPQSEADALRMRDKQARLFELPADRYPVVTRLLPVLIECDDPDVFLANGIDVVTLGIQGLAQRAAGTPTP